MKILHIITGLGAGGAEANLYRLCLSEKDNVHYVISLLGMGVYGPLLEKKGIKVFELKLDDSFIKIDVIICLYKIIKKINPDVVQAWMYHANFIGGIIAKISGVKKICWGIHHSNIDPSTSKKTTLFLTKISALFSYIIPTSIIYCADKSLSVHEGIGYNKKISKVIYNGFDIDYFKIGSERFDLNEQIESFFKIGFVARFDPLKDFDNFFHAIAIASNKLKVPCKCIMVGSGVDASNLELLGKIKKYNISDLVILLGRRDDIPKIMNSIDILVLSSYSEAFPNVLGEAMATSVPCITTDVGDAKKIVGDTGWVVPIRDPERLALAIQDAYSEFKKNFFWENRKKMAQIRISENFSLNKMVIEYKNEWRK